MTDKTLDRDQGDHPQQGLTRTDFHIGMEFFTASGRWRCTDIGTRTICAIKLDAPSADWYNGPPYAVVERVFDEYDFPALHREAVQLDPIETPASHYIHVTAAEADTSISRVRCPLCGTAVETPLQD